MSALATMPAPGRLLVLASRALLDDFLDLCDDFLCDRASAVESERTTSATSAMATDLSPNILVFLGFFFSVPCESGVVTCWFD